MCLLQTYVSWASPSKKAKYISLRVTELMQPSNIFLSVIELSYDWLEHRL